MTEIERTMTIDEIVKEFDELMASRTGDSPAKRDLIRAAASLGGKSTLPQLVRGLEVNIALSRAVRDGQCQMALALNGCAAMIRVF